MRTGFRVVACNCAHMASKAAVSLEPDVVLIAPQPSVERVSEIARAIKEDSATSDIPILLLTDNDQPEDFLSRAYPTEACLPVTCTDDEWRSTLRLLTRRASRRARGSRPAALEGSLEEDVFAELFHYLCLARKNGRVTIRSGGSLGRIDLDDGNVVHAELDEWTGVEAFEQICFLSRGRFEFKADSPAHATTMRKKGTDLLLQAIHKKDEMERSVPSKGVRPPEMTKISVKQVPHFARPRASKRTGRAWRRVRACAFAVLLAGGFFAEKRIHESPKTPEPAPVVDGEPEQEHHPVGMPVRANIGSSSLSSE